MNKRMRTRTPFHRLRQKAPRALMVLERHKAHPVIALFANTLVPTTQAFMEHFDATHAFAVTRATKATAQASAARHAWERTSMWLAFLARDVADFDAGAYASQSSSPADVIGAAERLLVFVADLEADGAQLPYAALMKDDLNEVMGVATSQWDQARGSLNELQTRQTDTRAHAVAFERELIAFRRALKVLLGPSNSDYQSLRTSRRTSTTEPGTEDAPSTLDAPATPEAPTVLVPQTPIMLNRAATTNGVASH